MSIGDARDLCGFESFLSVKIGKFLEIFYEKEAYYQDKKFTFGMNLFVKSTNLLQLRFNQ